MYPCHVGRCHDREGDYECKCNFGRRGDGKSYKGCEPIVSTAAVAVIGNALIIFKKNKQILWYRREKLKWFICELR